MENKNEPRKNFRAHLFLEASMGESQLAIEKNDKSGASMPVKTDESYIMSRRPTRLSLELLSRAKGKFSLPEAEELPKKVGGGR